MRKILLVIVLALLVVVGWYKMAQRPVDAMDDTRIQFIVDEGSSLTVIARALYERGIVRSEKAFKFFVRAHGAQASLQAGDFYLQKSMTSAQILETLRSGNSTDIAITIPEGFTVKDIEALLVEKGLIEEGELMECARSCPFEGYGFLPSDSTLAKRGGRVEGYLYPDTYFVTRSGFTPENFLRRMLDNFRTRIIDGLGPLIAGSKKPLHEIVTMASLIEEETRHDTERDIVSGILWKRLRENVSLGVDAAVRYIMEKPSSAITLKDLDSDSPYNLRKFRGLPPGPIANPGLWTIQAALHPEESKYWYYLHDARGQIHYAETNDEHNENKRLYLQ